MVLNFYDIITKNVCKFFFLLFYTNKGPQKRSLLPLIKFHKISTRQRTSCRRELLRKKGRQGRNRVSSN